MTPPRPDILWIVTTQWRAQSTGYAGDRNAITPFLDAFADRSINYCQAVTPHPFGPFARAALLSGRPCPENGVRDYYDPLPADGPSLARDLAAAGYDTAFFGKWHLGKRDPGAPLVGEAHARQVIPENERLGFGFWEGFESGFQLNDPWLHGTALPEPRRVPGYQSDVLVDRCLAWLGQRAPGRPVFSYLSLEPPHPPYAAPANGIHPMDTQALALRGNVPAGGDAEARARTELAGYYAHIEATDRALGKLLSSRHLANTIIVFTSVHGDMHGSHGHFRKGWPHEESLRVPMLVRLPVGLRRFQLGVASRDLVSLTDLHGWTRRWAGLDDSPPPPRLLQRCSMPSVVKLPLQCDRTWSCLRTEERKLVLNEDGSPWLYFDLRNDPLELTDLSGDDGRRQEIADLMKQAGLRPPA